MFRSATIPTFSYAASAATHVAAVALALWWSVSPSVTPTFRGQSKSKPLSLQASWMTSPPPETQPVTAEIEVAMAQPAAVEAPLAMETTVERRPAALPTELPVADKSQSASQTNRSTAIRRALRAPQTPTEQEREPERVVKRSGRQLVHAAVRVEPIPLGVEDETAPNFSVTRAPRYPDEARRLGQEGDVVLRLHVTARGTVEKAEVVESSGYPALDAAAQQATVSWRGRPAMRAGRAVETQVRLRIQFRIPR